MIDPPPGGWGRTIRREAKLIAMIVGGALAFGVLAGLVDFYRYGDAKHAIQAGSGAFSVCGIVLLVWTIISPGRAGDRGG